MREEREIDRRSVFLAYLVNTPSLNSSIVRERALDVLFINGVHSEPLLFLI